MLARPTAPLAVFLLVRRSWSYMYALMHAVCAMVNSKFSVCILYTYIVLLQSDPGCCLLDDINNRFVVNQLDNPNLPLDTIVPAALENLGTKYVQYNPLEEPATLPIVDSSKSFRYFDLS